MATDVAIIGACSISITTARYLVRKHGIKDIALIDQGQPMAIPRRSQERIAGTGGRNPFLVAAR